MVVVLILKNLTVLEIEFLIQHNELFKDYFVPLML